MTNGSAPPKVQLKSKQKSTRSQLYRTPKHVLKASHFSMETLAFHAKIQSLTSALTPSNAQPALLALFSAVIYTFAS